MKVKSKLSRESKIMNKKIITSLILIVLWMALSETWYAYHSPVTGTLTAAQLDDTLSSYVSARVIQNNFVEKTIGITFLVLIGVVWLIPSNKKSTKV